jgi:bifunctional DNA-binding transcriptional regulator/antitoxin component of YhaV-PrlF toxin-antitoxin module
LEYWSSGPMLFSALTQHSMTPPLYQSAFSSDHPIRSRQHVRRNRQGGTSPLARYMRAGYRESRDIYKGGSFVMPGAQARPIETIRVGDKGRIVVPPKYRKLHKLSKGSEVLLVQLGETLMVVPSDVTLFRLCERIQDALAGRGVSVSQALKNLGKVRRRRFQRLYGQG